MSIEKTEKKTEAAKEAQPVTETTGAAAYCGPTVKGIAPQYTVFVDGLPEKDGTRENILYKKAADLMK